MTRLAFIEIPALGNPTQGSLCGFGGAGASVPTILYGMDTYMVDIIINTRRVYGLFVDTRLAQMVQPFLELELK